VSAELDPEIDAEPPLDVVVAVYPEPASVYPKAAVDCPEAVAAVYPEEAAAVYPEASVECPEVAAGGPEVGAEDPGLVVEDFEVVADDPDLAVAFFTSAARLLSAVEKRRPALVAGAFGEHNWTYENTHKPRITISEGPF